MTDYRTYLEAIGRKPIPAYEDLRSERGPADVELPATARRWWPADVPSVRTGAQTYPRPLVQRLAGGGK